MSFMMSEELLQALLIDQTEEACLLQCYCVQWWLTSTRAPYAWSCTMQNSSCLNELLKDKFVFCNLIHRSGNPPFICICGVSLEG